MILKKEDAKFLWNRKDTVSVITGNELAGHTKSPFLMVHDITRWTETAFAGKRYRFKFTTMGTAIDSMSIRRILAMDHTFDVIHNIFARTKNILDVLKVVTENSLKNVLFIHKNILQQILREAGVSNLAFELHILSGTVYQRMAEIVRDTGRQSALR